MTDYELPLMCAPFDGSSPIAIRNPAG
ncbi:hypothetical protein GBAR_LOCUS25357 [Geodia barretti]|uniref:Uncharacterized protein n=1 Tax=Geodia barretti TaxID=519541 RepID=A0AA35X6C4_GEOBA|nr:hypothetical protein GBAR_LOCUS25357 [Geodia barretti]